jgi:LPXTG-site transpeptidase (sortase) family protein
LGWVGDPLWGLGVAWAGLGVGLVLLLAWALPLAADVVRQQSDQGKWNQIVATAPARTASSDAPDPRLMVPVDGIDFRISVPKLGYSAVVREGIDLSVLASGPGHYPNTVWPGQAGNVGVAAHNVFWLRFDELRPGDRIVLQTRYGTFAYRMTGRTIVDASAGWVLASVPGRRLTLTTCWPLWAGQFASKRLVIFADTA